MKKLFAILMILATLLLSGCRTLDPVVQYKIIVPDLSTLRIDVYELFPLIDEPQTDADLMYNSLVNEFDSVLANAYADVLELYNAVLAEQLTTP